MATLQNKKFCNAAGHIERRRAKIEWYIVPEYADREGEKDDGFSRGNKA
jgi:hypothetical protein